MSKQVAEGSKDYSFINWLTCLVKRKPHFIIGSEERPYLLRWYLIPRNKYLNLYLHRFLRSDDDRALHDHPWWFVSILIRGQYNEITSSSIIYRSSFSLAYRPALWRHRVELVNNNPCWTVVLTGKTRRIWGFWCPKGFVPWFEFTKQSDSGEIGKGCE